MMDKSKAGDMEAYLSQDNASTSMVGTVELKVFDGEGNQVDIGDHFKHEFIGANGILENQTLDTAKKVFSRLAAGDVNFKIGKIGFGNAGHNFDNPRQAVAAVTTDTELKSTKHIRDSLNDADTAKHFLYQDGGGTNHRMVFVEKDIGSEHITYGANDNQFIVKVPISYSDFNARVGGAETTDVEFMAPMLSYKTINPNDGTIMEFAGVDTGGTATAGFTEVHSWDDSGTRRYSFKNGLNAAGSIDTTNGGDRPQELSEILLSTDITGLGTTEVPYEKLGTSRMTTGLLTFPENFEFEYSWTLSWDFSEA